MEKFIEELQAYCKRSGHEILFTPERAKVVERTTGCKWVSDHDPKSLAALVHAGLGESHHKELLEALESPVAEAPNTRLEKAMKASREYLARTKKDRDGN